MQEMRCQPDPKPRLSVEYLFFLAHFHVHFRSANVCGHKPDCGWRQIQAHNYDPIKSVASQLLSHVTIQAYTDCITSAYFSSYRSSIAVSSSSNASDLATKYIYGVIADEVAEKWMADDSDDNA